MWHTLIAQFYMGHRWVEPQFSDHYTNWAAKGIVHRRLKIWEGLVPTRMSSHERSKWIHHLDKARGGGMILKVSVNT